MNKAIIILIIILAVVGGYFYFSSSTKVDVSDEQDTLEDTSNDTTTTTDDQTDDTSMEDDTSDSMDEGPVTVIGTSAGGNDINAYHFGSGENELLIVGGIHGGYSWNTALLAQQIVVKLEEGSLNVPDGLRVTVVPVLNPDGLIAVAGLWGVLMQIRLT